MALADWDARLISPERALHLAGDWPIYAETDYANLAQFGSQPGQLQINLRCGKCGQSCGMLANLPSDQLPLHGFSGPETSIGDLLSGVLRHLVTAHDWSLSGAVQGQPPVKPESGTPLVISGPEDHARYITAMTEADYER